MNKNYSDLLSIENLSIEYSRKEILKDISFSVREGDGIGIIGPSGCGKTTLLRCISGLEVEHSGIVLFKGDKVRGPESFKNEIGFIFQDLGLFENSTSLENILLGMKKSQFGIYFDQIIDRLGLDGLLSESVNKLSGGERQRVAIARCLIRKPSVLFLDEPFSSLDMKITMDLENLIFNLKEDLAFTLLYVTHNQASAARLCDHLLVINNGHLIQAGKFEELYFNPNSEMVMNFMAEWPVNLLRSRSWGRVLEKNSYARPEKISIIEDGSSCSKGYVAQMRLERIIPNIPLDYLVFKGECVDEEIVCINNGGTKLCVGLTYTLYVDEDDVMRFATQD